MPHQVLHGVGQAYLCRQRTLTLDVIDVLIRAKLHPCSISLLDRVQKVPSLREEMVAVVLGLPVMFNPASSEHLVAQGLIAAQDFEDLSFLRQTFLLLVSL